MNYQAMLRARQAGVTSGSGLLLLELLRLAAVADRWLCLAELQATMPTGYPGELVADLVRRGLLVARLQPGKLRVKEYLLSNAGREVVGLPMVEETNPLPPRPPRPQGRPWTPKEDAALGKSPDETTARFLNRTLAAVRVRRNLLGVAMYEARLCAEWEVISAK